MVKRRNLRPDPARAFADLLARTTDQATQQTTVPAGVKDLGTTGDVIWDDGQKRSVRALPGLLDQLEDQLASGLATTSRMNTVSTSPPGDADGYPDGALWTRVEVADGDLVERARWVIHDGQWQPVGLDATTLTTGKVDAALIDVVALAAKLVTSGLIRTGAIGQRLEMTPEGLVMYGVDPDGAEYEMVRIGPSGTQLLTIGGATIDGDGDAVLQDVEVRSLAIAGTSLADRLAALPQGIIGRGYRSSPWTERRKSLTRVVELPVTLQPGRTYRVSSSPIPFVTDTGAAWVFGNLQWAPVPVTDVAQFSTLSKSAAMDSGTSLLPPMSRIVTTSDLAAPKDYSFIIRTSCATTYHQIAVAGVSPVELVVEDLGPAISYTGANWQDAAEAGTSSGNTSPPATVQRYSLHRDHTAVGTYRRGQSGLKSSGDAVQGQYGSYGNREGMWLFADMTGALSGSTVEKVVLNFTISHTYAASGGIAEVRLHGNAAFPSGAAGLNTVVSGVKVRAGGAYSVTITDAAMCAGFRSGAYRGFGLSTDSTNLDHYVRGQNASMDVTYRK